jgi:hypothetical protein
VTFTDFQVALKDIKNNAAPGPSVLSANMDKKWSAAIQFAVYEHMYIFWLKRATTSWIKDKVIRLAPKVPGSSDLKHMRPMSLYEVVRKLWTTIIAKQIYLLWHQNDVLNCI